MLCLYSREIILAALLRQNIKTNMTKNRDKIVQKKKELWYDIFAISHNPRRNISITRLRYSANHNTLDSWPIRAHLASQNDELCKNWRVSERRSNNNIQYVENIYFFLTLNRIDTMNYT